MLNHESVRASEQAIELNYAELSSAVRCVVLHLKCERPDPGPALENFINASHTTDSG